jgi:hypothetical protein
MLDVHAEQFNIHRLRSGLLSGAPGILDERVDGSALFEGFRHRLIHLDDQLPKFDGLVILDRVFELGDFHDASCPAVRGRLSVCPAGSHIRSMKQIGSL